MHLSKKIAVALSLVVAATVLTVRPDTAAAQVSQGVQYCSAVCDADATPFDYVYDAGYPPPRHGYDHSICVPGYQRCWNQATAGTPTEVARIAPAYAVLASEPGAQAVMYWGVQPAWGWNAPGAVTTTFTLPAGCRLKWVDFEGDPGSSWFTLSASGPGFSEQTSLANYSGFGVVTQRLWVGHTAGATAETVTLKVRAGGAGTTFLTSRHMYNCPGA